MVKGQLDSFLHYLRGLIGPGTGTELSDGQLLRQFASHQDEAAFTALMQRHGAMVFGVCRRVLGQLQEAEDVFQATFLLLARKAGSIRNPKSVGSWLYGTAHRLAIRAKANAIQRRACERQVRQMPPADPMGEAIGRELRLVLDEELSRLPEKYRAPLVLCYLEGKTNRQAAQELGWSEGSMSWRLARGRQLLGRRLTRRGLVLSGAPLVTLLAAEATAATAPAELVPPTIQAALLYAVGKTTEGLLSAQVTALVEGPSHALLPSKLKIAGAILLAASILAGGAGALAFRALAKPSEAKTQDLPRTATADLLEPADGKPMQLDRPSRAAEQVPERISFSGEVLDAKGKPVAGAMIFLREQPISWDQLISASGSPWHPTKTRNLARTASDEQGQFAFRDVALGEPVPFRKEVFPLDVLVLARGHGVAWRHLATLNEPRPLQIRLPTEGRLQGRVVDSRGKPIAGVRVQALQIAQLGQSVRPGLQSAGYVDLQYAQVPVDAKTDVDGRFILRALPREARVTLRFSDTRFLSKEIYAATTDRAQPKLVADPDSGADWEPDHSVFTRSLTVVLQPSHRLRGRAVFVDTGKPIPGAGIGFLILPPQQAADSQGRFTLDQLPPGKHYVEIWPPEGSDYLAVRSEFDIPVDKPEVQQTVGLPRGIIVTGRVVDEQTGMGIPGVEVHHFQSGQVDASQPFARSTRTGPDGSFRLAIPPGKGHLAIPGTVPGYVTDGRSGSMMDVDRRYVRDVEARGDRPFAEVRFTLSRGRVIAGRVLDPSGKPVSARIDTRHFSAPNSFRELTWSTDAAGTFTVSGLHFDQAYELLFTNQQLQLGAKVEVAAFNDEKNRGPLEVKLQPMVSVTGRVVDESGKPVSGALAQLMKWTKQFGENAPRRAAVLTDADGKFRLDNQIPNIEYSVEVSAEGYTWAFSRGFMALDRQHQHLPDLILWKTDQLLGGLLVSSTGKPLPGVRVWAHSVDRQVRGERELQVTDEQGRFHITGLPRGQVELWAIAPWDKKHSSILGRFSAGKQNLRIVMSLPRVQEPID